MSSPHNPYDPPTSPAGSAGSEVRIGSALKIGCLITLATYGISFFAGAAGLVLLARVLSWPSSALLSLVPPLNIGTPENPIYEGTPVHMLAWVSGIPLSFFLYSVAGYFWLRFRSGPARA